MSDSGQQGPDSGPAGLATSPEMELAVSFLRHTDCSLFLTGRAGTGKTTFLRRLPELTPKAMMVTAPTGVAAVNAGGVTLHSFFQLPFGPQVPGMSTDGGRQHRFSNEKKAIIRALDLLVIDEVSMVRADVLDGVDAVLRRFRRREAPFGGVQLLLIGDLGQLPPVVRDEEWALLREFYDSPYFFASQALARDDLVAIELKQVFRQADDRFINLLNRIRDNRIDQPLLDALNQRVNPDFQPPADEGWITLCTHNRQAEAVNRQRLAGLPGREHVFRARIEGDFPAHAHPTGEHLVLKEGAQVMFIRNDPTPARRYFNGKIGRITRITGQGVRVECADGTVINVEPATWENFRYAVDAESREIRRTRQGAFVQIPLKPAWAITVHKSQGLTFARAIIDVSRSFAPGQVYVALSRLRSLEGLVLSAPVPAAAVHLDPMVATFMTRMAGMIPDQEDLRRYQCRYQRRLLCECFDFRELDRQLGRNCGVMLGNRSALHLTGPDPGQLRDRARGAIVQVGKNFVRQLDALLAPEQLAEHDPVIRERVGKAHDYFRDHLNTLADGLAALGVESDNRELSRRLKRFRRELEREIARKRAAIDCCRDGFSAQQYLRALAESELVPEKSPSPSQVQYSEADVGHPELFARLKKWRSEQAAAQGVPPYRILHQRVLVQIAVTLPDSLEELAAVKGVGPRTLERYGAELVEIVSGYRREHGIEAVSLPEPAGNRQEKKQDGAGKRAFRKGESRQISLELFTSGLDIGEVAARRGLAVSTVTRHLIDCVREGLIDLERLVTPERRRTIGRILAAHPDKPLKEIREMLGNDYEYGEISLVRARLRYEQQRDRDHPRS